MQHTPIATALAAAFAVQLASGQALIRSVRVDRPGIEHSIVFDQARGRLVQFGGGRFVAGSVPGRIASYAETWEWRDGWSRRGPSPTPAATQGAGMAYDATRQESLLFGGAGDPVGTWS